MTKKRRKMKMKRNTKRYTILQKKLEELEHLLHGAVLGGNPNLRREIELRFVFAKTLLAAEIQSRRGTVQEGEDGHDDEELINLACMARRLTELEEAFNRWTGHDNGSVTDMLESGGSVDVETGSVCSCTESCLNDGGQAEEDEEEEEEEEADAEEELENEFPDGSAAGEVAEEAASTGDVGMVGERKRVGAGVLVSFGVMGFFVGMVSFFGYFDDRIKYDVFLTPT